MEFRILGAMEVYCGDLPLALGGSRCRALLADLLLHANEVVGIERLIDDLWAESPPETAQHILHVYVSQLRKAFDSCDAPPVLFTERGGYVLRVPLEHIDAPSFERLAIQGRSLLAHDPAESASTLKDALALWRGDALAEFRYEPFAAPEASRLDELRLTADEDRLEAELILGRQGEVVGKLSRLVREHPLRERLRGQLMIALYRSGRQTEALATYREYRRSLADELGVDPGPVLRELEIAILQHDPALREPADGGQPAPTMSAEGIVRPPRRWLRARALLVATVVAGLAILAAVSLATPDGRLSAPPESLVQIDAASGKIMKVTGGVRNPSALAVNAGTAWVADIEGRTVSEIDIGSGKTIAIQGDVGFPASIAASAGALWVADPFAGMLTEVDSRSRSVVLKTDSIRAPTALAVGYGSLWVTDPIYSRVVRVDLAQGQIVATIPLPSRSQPTAIAVGAGGVWVADGLSPTIARIDPTSDVVSVARIALGFVPEGITGCSTSVWVTGRTADEIARVDPKTNRVAQTLRMSGHPGAVACVGSSTWVALGDLGTILELSPSGSIVARVPTSGSPTALAAAGGFLLATIGPR